MTIAKLNPREQLLLIAAVPIIILALYASIRIPSQQQNIKIANEELDNLKTEIKQKNPKRGKPAPAIDESKINTIKQEINNLSKEQELLGLQEEAASPEQVQKQLLEILSLARSAGLKMEAAGIHKDKSLFTGIQASEPSVKSIQLPNRPVYQLSMSGTYPYFLRFVQDLAVMQRRVNILRFSMQADGVSYPRLLNFELSLVL